MLGSSKAYRLATQWCARRHVFLNAVFVHGFTYFGTDRVEYVRAFSEKDEQYIYG